MDHSGAKGKSWFWVPMEEEDVTLARDQWRNGRR